MQTVKNTEAVQLKSVHIDNELYYQISNVDKMRPFFMSIVSNSNHWMFIGSSGGLTAGRKNANHALFPYYTDDKIIESAEHTGSKTIFRIEQAGRSIVWEPFSIRNSGVHTIERNLYKNIYGNKVLFEEVHHDLNLTFQYQWNSGQTFGFIRRATLFNTGSKNISVAVVDGIQNIMPHGVGSMLQNQVSNLVDAYKRNELDKEGGIGMYALSAIIVDKAEPSEALKANIAWSCGLENPTHLLSSLQLENFRKGLVLQEEVDVKAERGAYFLNTEISLPPNARKEWMIVANVNQNVSQIIQIRNSIKRDKNIRDKINEDITLGTSRLIELTASSDGIQLTDDNLKDTRHFSNTLFNIMRGGIFDKNYQIEKSDLIAYLENANRDIMATARELIQGLPEEFTLHTFHAHIEKSEDPDFRRLCQEYLPLKFSRRHGDPSRPWNQFSINTQRETDGSKILDYEGNWRDIFQNWEALVHSYPSFIEGMIFKFLNASTFDGYNPYRITKNGIDWERIEKDDPWSYIGYWGDHQIIYLLKFLEFIENHSPGKLQTYFNKNVFVYANVPYKIKPYGEILNNPKDTVVFDDQLDREIKAMWDQLGADSALLRNQHHSIHHVNFIEKILASVLAKISNFIPEGGIWMNTQRPEWNDANNALVGNGISVITLCYLRRFLAFFKGLLDKTTCTEVRISEEMVEFFESVRKTLNENQHLLLGPISNTDRKTILDGLGIAGSNYRQQIYTESFSDQFQTLQINKLSDFVELTLRYLEHTIRANKRHDDLYHAYNLMTIENDTDISISYLSEMLEGQVAILSAGYLSAKEALGVLDGLKSSSLFRTDQQSYILYPNKDLPGFLEKNTIPKQSVSKSVLLTKLVTDGNVEIVEQDELGASHFNGNFKNSSDLKSALASLAATAPHYSELIASGGAQVLQIFEEVFNHKAFTGRSGTFFGYEGLGSIYWHMVSKLQLAVQECCLKAIEAKESEVLVERLLEHYYEINEGIGIHKSPTRYGAFPTDPYSHTPSGKGAQQPGMTGQVKEDILSRFGELGVSLKEGSLIFNPCMLRKEEFLSTSKIFRYADVDRNWKELQLEAGSLCFLYCQVPVVYTLTNQIGLEVEMNDGLISKSESLMLDPSVSQKIFDRSGDIRRVIVQIKETMVRKR